MGTYTSDNTVREKVIWQANSRLSAEIFVGENVDELIKICQYFPPSKFCAIWYILFCYFNWPKVDRHLKSM